jgi:hypothetical protein
MFQKLIYVEKTFVICEGGLIIARKKILNRGNYTGLLNAFIKPIYPLSRETVMPC